jgi:glycosyltransferase involved in cell wall biosynthesis
MSTTTTSSGERSGERSMLAGGDGAVGQVIGSFGGGGAQRLAYNVAVGLGDRRVRSFAIALREAGHYTQEPDPRVTTVSFSSKSSSVMSLVRSAKAFRDLVRKERLRVLHVHGTSSLPFVAIATLGMAKRPKLAFTWQDSESVLNQKGWRRACMIWALRRCDSVSGSCQKVAAILRSGARLDEVGIFHGGVPMTLEPSERPEAEPRIVWLGRMVPPKDPQALVRAAAAMRREGHRFSVDLVGKPIPSTQWYFDQTRELIASSGLEGVVRAPGFVSDDGMKTIMAEAQIGVQTSHTEGMSIALMEQMMAGLAIIATDVGDTACAIRHEENGLLVPAKDPAALDAALRRLLADPELRRRLGRAARETAVRDFSLDAVSDRALREYERLVEKA